MKILCNTADSKPEHKHTIDQSSKINSSMEMKREIYSQLPYKIAQFCELKG